MFEESTKTKSAAALRLPDPLRFTDGRVVESTDDWSDRAAEIRDVFQDQVYGRAPEAGWRLSHRVFEGPTVATRGGARRKQVELTIETARGRLRIPLLIYLPPGTETPVPAFIILNFNGNHRVAPDPEISLPEAPLPESQQPAESHRGENASRFPIEAITSRGYALVTAHSGDIDPDFDDGFGNGIHRLFDNPEVERPADAWGTVAAWAWGMSRILDYLESDPDIDATRVAAAGHSRKGKTALWAGACDPRFALVISNESGCTGAALARNRKGESIERINSTFPHWFCRHYRRYNDREDDLPVDQHMLVSLLAPRPVCIASATGDAWADPEGEFLSGVHASPVYRLFGLEGLDLNRLPEPERPLQDGAIAYHLRTGDHDLTAWDWEQFMNFADRFLQDR